jgi:phosphopantetheine adenylyltransferase
MNKSLKEFLDKNSLIYSYIWYFLNEKGIKIPINEYNTLDKEKCIKKMNVQNKKLNEVMKKPLNYKKSGKMIELTEKEYNSLVPCYSIYLKHIDNVYILDIDDKNIKKIEDLPLLEYNIFKDCHYTSGNTKGIHIYLKIIDMIKYKNQQKILKSIDGDLIKMNNIWEGVSKEIYGSKDNLIKEFKWNDISMIFDKNKMNIEKDDIFSMSTEVLYIKKDVDNISEISDITEKRVFKGIDITEKNNDNKIELELFKKYLEGLSEKKSDEYLYWSQTIWIIYNVSKANGWSLKVRNELIHNFSKKSSKYNESETDDFIENNIKENGTLGVGTLITWYKEDNKELIKEDLIIDYSERGMALLFLKLNENILIYQDGLMYIYYKNEWRNDKKLDLCKYIISETLIDHIIKEKIKIDKIISKLLKESSSEEELEELREKQNFIINFINKLKTIKFIGEIIKQTQTILAAELKKIIFDVGDDQKYNIHFKNGVYDLKKKEFRRRCYHDYITQYLDYDYIEKECIEESIHNFVYDFFKKIQPDKIQMDFTLGYLAYCITGDTGKQIFKINIGYSASNGKSTEIKIHEKTFEIYTTKLNKETFDKHNSKRHKYIYKCLHNPIRLCYIEELDKSLLDSDFLKDWVDGNKICNEILYGTSEEMKIQAKLMTFSNKDFSIDGDEGIYRRGKVQFYESRFDNYLEDDYKNNRYKKILNFEGYFDDIKYKNAYFHLLLKYIDKLNIPDNAEKNFKDIVDENDNLKNDIEDFFIITKNDNDKISKKIVEKILNNYNFKDILSKMKNMGVKYIKDSRLDGEKGVFYGIEKI